MQGKVFFFDWEVSLMAALQGVMGPVGETVGGLLTMLGENIVLVVVIALFYFCLNKDHAKLMMTTVGAGMIWNPLVKNVALRRRPYFDNPSIRCLKPVDASGDLYDISLQGYSFPSGHSQHSLAVFAMTARWVRRRWMTLISVAVPLAVGLSRVMLGVHYPTDVLVGWLLGIVCITVIPALWKRLDHRLVYLIVALSGAPGLLYCITADFYAGYGITLGAFAAFLFEEKYVNFAPARGVVQGAVRLALAGALYGVLNLVLKLPFSHAWLDGGSTGALLVRLGRYAVIGFTVFGLYPLSFKFLDRLTKSKKEGVSL